MDLINSKIKVKAAIYILLLLSIGLEDGRCYCAVVQFIFGDSLSDVGNNNYLTKSLARAALPWYGIDFGRGMPNGRFTNGRTIADIVGDKMGLPRPPAFLDPSLNDDTILSKGVSYASGGGGILNETSSLFIQRFSLSKQIELFQGTQEMIKMKIGESAASKFFQQAHYVVALGSNDYINNYLLPVYADSWTYNGETFTNYLINSLEGQLRILHSLGARKLTFFGLGPMGCIPLQRLMTSSGKCQESTNKLSIMFNNRSMTLLQTLSKTLPNATFQFGDAYDIFQDLINRPEIYGFSNSNAPCCTIGKIRPTLTCTPLSSLCKDRSVETNCSLEEVPTKFRRIPGQGVVVPAANQTPRHALERLTVPAARGGASRHPCCCLGTKRQAPVKHRQAQPEAWVPMRLWKRPHELGRFLREIRQPMSYFGLFLSPLRVVI